MQNADLRPNMNSPAWKQAKHAFELETAIAGYDIVANVGTLTAEFYDSKGLLIDRENYNISSSSELKKFGLPPTSIECAWIYQTHYKSCNQNTYLNKPVF